METTVKLKLGFAALMIVSGIGVAMYPVVSNAVAQRHASSVIESYNDNVQSMDAEKIDAAKEAARRYNQQLNNAIDRDAAGEADDIGTSYVDMLDVGESLGYITIPKIDVNLPIYEGTSDDVLVKGVGHLEGSSYPLGGAGTHSVLTGHRGLAEAVLFTDLDKLGEGDRFYLHIMDEVLAYQVDQVKVVEPENTEDLEIIPGGDYCTLVTCTPYAINTHRMLVRGARVPYTGEDEQPDTPQTVQYQQLNTGNVVKRIVDAWPWISVTGSVVIGGEALLLLLLLHRCKKARGGRLMKRLFLQIFAWLAILLGVGLMLQPTVSRYLTEQKSTKTVQKFVQAAEAAAPAAPETSAAEPARAYPELYDAFLAYNQQLFAQGQSGLKDPFAYETPAFDLTGCGLPDDVIAALWIPRLDLELPVYLGANAANMARGGALLGQTSMPLGGENTNTVIAAHRGYYGAEMLRNVQQIQIGDKITLTTPWDTLVYRVCELKIIQPDDINAVLIQPGRDLLTLTTCHPYTQNTQRYLVIAERDPDAEAATHAADLAECDETWDAAPRQVTVEDDGTSALEEVTPESITPLPHEGGGENAGGAYSNWVIWLENNALWAGCLLIAAVIGCMLIWRRHRKD